MTPTAAACRHLMAQRVVHVLEAIEIEEQHREVRLPRRRASAIAWVSGRSLSSRRFGRPVSTSCCARSAMARAMVANPRPSGALPTDLRSAPGD